MQVNPATFLDPQGLSARGAFRNQYLSMMISAHEYQELLEAQSRLFETLVSTDTSQRSYREWSYSLAIGNDRSYPHEIHPRSEYAESHNPATRSEVVAISELSEDAQSPHRHTTRSSSTDSQYRDSNAG
jgi:hypothetical protein